MAWWPFGKKKAAEPKQADEPQASPQWPPPQEAPPPPQIQALAATQDNPEIGGTTMAVPPPEGAVGTADIGGTTMAVPPPEGAVDPGAPPADPFQAPVQPDLGRTLEDPQPGAEANPFAQPAAGGDPFAAPAADPFAAPATADPFAAPAAAANPFAASAAADPFAAPAGDPFAAPAAPVAARATAAAVRPASDPFAAAPSGGDPFAAPVPGQDPFTPTGAADPFAAPAPQARWGAATARTVLAPAANEAALEQEAPPAPPAPKPPRSAPKAQPQPQPPAPPKRASARQPSVPIPPSAPPSAPAPPKVAVAATEENAMLAKTVLSPEKRRLGLALLAGGPITHERLLAELDRSGKSGSVLGKALLQSNFPHEDEILAVLVARVRIPKINVKNTKIPLETIKLLPADIARKTKILPIEKLGDILVVVSPDISDETSLNMVRKATGCLISPIQCAPEGFEEILEGYYSRLGAEAAPVTAEPVAAAPASVGSNGPVPALRADEGDGKDSWSMLYAHVGPVPAEEALL